MKINTNTVSLITQNHMRKNNANLETNMQRLSSGKRINSAADDAAGLAIAARMQTKIKGMEVGIRNTNDGISLIQTTESALGSIENILQRMRELTVQSANGTNTAADRTSLNNEFIQLRNEIDHIAANTTFNGLSVMNGVGTVSIQISDVSGDKLDLNLMDAKSSALNGGTGLLTDITTADNATIALTELDVAINEITNARAEYGANLNRMNFNVDNYTNMSINLENSKSRIEDADMAREVSDMTKNKILLQSGVSMLTQANENPQMILKLLE